MIENNLILRWKDLCFDCLAYRASWQGRSIQLTPIELHLLKYFLQNPKSTISYDEILCNLTNKDNKLVWQSIDDWPGIGTLNSHINSLRRKFRQVVNSTELIENVHGIGHRLSESD